jgi:hypothetical protein
MSQKQWILYMIYRTLLTDQKEILQGVAGYYNKGIL